jgi:hypothetical protein
VGQVAVTRFAVVVATVLLLSTAACGGSSATTGTSTSATTSSGPTSTGTMSNGAEQRFPDVVAAVATQTDAGWDFDVTVSSPYDTPERYADAWRVVGPDGVVLGVRELAHDHAGEQPFTRSLRGVQIPAGVDRVVVEGRDRANGWGGATVVVVLDAG